MAAEIKNRIANQAPQKTAGPTTGKPLALGGESVQSSGGCC